MIFGECDCCGKNNRVLARAEASGLEAFACAECRYGCLSEDIDDLESEIEDILASKPETAEAWAHICSLETALIEARAASAKYKWAGAGLK